MSKAYEILYDDEKKQLYDQHGMAAFDPANGHGMGPEVDLEEMLHHMFGMGGMPPGFSGPGVHKPQKGEDEERPYQVTLEELYKGKTAKFSSKKNVICKHCNGTGGKEKAKSKQCGSCQGRGRTTSLCLTTFGLELMIEYRLQTRSKVCWPGVSHLGNSNM